MGRMAVHAVGVPGRIVPARGLGMTQLATGLGSPELHGVIHCMAVLADSMQLIGCSTAHIRVTQLAAGFSSCELVPMVHDVAIATGLVHFVRCVAAYS